ncbi:hypothetical protein C8A05DRAFT_13535 [Staphylotrichum tortipilum]|uniref:Carboxylesterase family protein n=1 Tax=Staphylotrichum tortipilum TaxID=2831512 RepID=A0AAN6RV48_9PEZI|nr:hypothetical protein C8A05DRAFT_13535 [Staphylotrichum longicolle]
MATTARSRPCVDLDIHMDHHAHDHPALGELSLNSIHNIKRRSSIESLARQLDNFHICSVDKENKSRAAAEAKVPAPLPDTKDLVCGGGTSSASGDLDNTNTNALSLASQHIASTREQLSKHQQGQFEWLLSVPLPPSSTSTAGAAKGRRPRSDSHSDAELRHHSEEETLYFGCNLVRRRSQSGGSLESDRPTDVYTLLATRIQAQDDFVIPRAREFDAAMELAPATTRLHHSDTTTAMAGRLEQGFHAPRSPQLAVGGGSSREMYYGDASPTQQPSRPLSRIEDSVEALDKLEEEIEALAHVTRMERVLSPEAAAARNMHSAAGKSTSTPLKRATSVRATPGSAAAKSSTLGRSASVRKQTPAATDEEKAASAAAGSATSPSRRVPRPTSLLPPKPPAKSSKAPTVAAFELPGEAVARRLKEQREQRRSQHISSEQAAAALAAYSPSKPHFKSSKLPTRPTFELPGEAISRRKREEHEAKLRAQEEEERKRREFKARPIRGAVVAPGSTPRENLASLARQKSRHGISSSSTTESSDGTTVTPAASKRQSLLLSSSTLKPTTTATFPTRGRPPSTTVATNPRAASTISTASNRSSNSGRTSSTTATNTPTVVTPQEAAQQKQRGREVLARDNSFTAEREREKRERENAARVAREQAAERSRELSRLWKERQRRKMGGVVEGKGEIVG